MDARNTAIHTVNDVFKESMHVRFAFFIARLLCDLGTALVYPLTRYGMGERRFNLTYIIAMFITVLIVSHLHKVESFYLSLYLGSLCLATSFHLFVIWRRNVNQEIVHSYFEGNIILERLIKMFPGGSNAWILEGVYEPLLVVIAGMAIYLFLDQGLGGLLIFSSAWMVLRVRYYYTLYRKKLLDSRDRHIEANHHMDALNGKPSKDTKGFVVRNATNFSEMDRQILSGKTIQNTDFSSLTH